MAKATLHRIRDLKKRIQSAAPSNCRRGPKLEYCHCSGIDYPLTVYTDVVSEEYAAKHQEVAELGKSKKWDKLIEKLEKFTSFVHHSELPIDGEPPIPYRTPLHYAAAGGAPKEILEKMLELGASRCMKTETGQTAYDLAKSDGRTEDILQLLRVPEDIKQDEEAITKMEAGLHSVINGRVESLIRTNGQSLPQLSFLLEKGKDRGFYYLVPGMYGGFSVWLREDGNLQADSLIRICGGSEQNHLIDREGNVTLLRNDCPM